LLRYRRSVRSLWTLRPVTVVTAAIIVFVLGASPATPIIRVTRGEEGRRSYSLPPASAESLSGAPLRPTPFQRRGCELPVDLLGPCGAFTKPCRPLTFSLSPAGTPESESFPPDVLSYRRRVDPRFIACRRRAEEELTCWSEDLASPCWLRARRAWPENAFCRVVSPRAETHERYAPRVFTTIETHPHRFAFYPSAPVRQALLRISFWLVPSFCHRPTLRLSGEEGTRCVQPTSATQTNHVHPHFVRSRLTSLVTQRGRPTETKAPYDTIGGPGVSRHPRPLRLDYDLLAYPELYSLTGWRHGRGRFLPTTLRRSNL